MEKHFFVEQHVLKLYLIYYLPQTLQDWFRYKHIHEHIKFPRARCICQCSKLSVPWLLWKGNVLTLSQNTNVRVIHFLSLCLIFISECHTFRFHLICKLSSLRINLFQYKFSSISFTTKFRDWRHFLSLLVHVSVNSKKLFFGDFRNIL